MNLINLANSRIPMMPISHVWIYYCRGIHVKSLDSVITSRYKNIFQTSWKCVAACGLFLGLSIATYGYSTSEKSAMMIAKKKFDESYTYESKRRILSYLPEPRLPILENQNFEEWTQDKWAQQFIRANGEIRRSWLLKTINYMRENLIKEINTFSDTNLKIKELQNILPISLELTVMTEEIIQEKIKINGNVSSDILNTTLSHQSDTPYSISSKLVQFAISSYPGQQDELILYLQSDSNLNDINNINKSNLITTHQNNDQIKQALIELKVIYDALHPLVRESILLRVAISTISHVRHSNPHQYKEFVKDRIIGLLKRNLVADRHIISEIRTVFENLPVGLQAKMFLTSLNLAKSSDSSNSSNSSKWKVMRDMMGHSIVLIKLGQIAAEDPNLPKELREILSNLRNSNKQQSLIDLWSRIPESVRADIVTVGKCLGVGSIKQVHQITMKEIEIINKNNENINYVLCCVKGGIEDDALSTFKALEKVSEIEGIVKRLKSIVMREIDMCREAQAFEILRSSKFGLQSFVHIPEVMRVTTQFMIRTEAIGTTLAELYKNPNQLSP